MRTVTYKAVIFDLGKVLVHFDFMRGYRALEGLCPYTVSEIRRRIGSTDLVKRFETGLIEPPEFVAEFSRTLDLQLDYDHFCRIWSCIFTEALIPDSMLEGLAARYRLILLSNTNAIHLEMVRQAYPLLRHFHDLVLSYEVKAMKPDPRIYREAVSRARCLPEECFYTDDIAENVEGARLAGIDAVQFESAEQIQRELLDRGIVWA